MKKRKKKEKGFTLVEALISISILMISIVAPLSVASSSLIAAKIAEKQIVAAYLAQDALEFVINKKAENKILNYSDTAGLLANDLNSCLNHGCYIDTVQDIFNPYSSSNEYKTKYIYLNNSGVYSYNVSGKKTDFTRVVKINRVKEGSGAGAVDSDDEAVVEVTVHWKTDSIEDREYTLTSKLTKW